MVGVGYAVVSTYYAMIISRSTAALGQNDSFFGSNGLRTESLTNNYDGLDAVAIAPDGTILGAGWAGSGSTGSAALVRFTANGAIDATFGASGAVKDAFSLKNV